MPLGRASISDDPEVFPEGDPEDCILKAPHDARLADEMAGGRGCRLLLRAYFGPWHLDGCDGGGLDRAEWSLSRDQIETALALTAVCLGPR
jgi:hypothetical protein